MLKFAVADPTGDFIYQLRLGIKLFPPENDEEISIDRYSSNMEIQNTYVPGKYDAVIICYRLGEYTGVTVPNYIRQMDSKVVIACYLKDNFLYIDKSDPGRYELTGKRPPDYEEQLIKLYKKCRKAES